MQAPLRRVLAAFLTGIAATVEQIATELSDAEIEDEQDEVGEPPVREAYVVQRTPMTFRSRSTCPHG